MYKYLDAETQFKYFMSKMERVLYNRKMRTPDFDHSNFKTAMAGQDLNSLIFFIKITI